MHPITLRSVGSIGFEFRNIREHLHGRSAGRNRLALEAYLYPTSSFTVPKSNRGYQQLVILPLAFYPPIRCDWIPPHFSIAPGKYVPTCALANAHAFKPPVSPTSLQPSRHSPTTRAPSHGLIMICTPRANDSYSPPCNAQKGSPLHGDAATVPAAASPHCRRRGVCTAQ